MSKYKIKLDGIINTIERGIGISLLPAELIAKNYQHRELSTIPFLKNKTMMKIFFIRRKDYPITKVYQRFLENLLGGYSKTVN